MRHYSMPISVAAIACGLLAGATAVQAGNETWVSGTGSDTGTRPRTAPCRTFAYAHSQTTAQGAINVLNSGDFGPLTITKAISIVSDGVEGAINSIANGAAILVQAPATAIVSLRGLTIDPHGAPNTGILFEGGKALHVRDTVIRNVGNALFFGPPPGVSELYIADSVIADGGSDQVVVQGSGNSTIRARLDRVRIENGPFNGLVFRPGNTPLNATVRSSVISGHGGTGILASTTGGTVNVMLDRTVSMSNGTGVFASGAAATIRIGDSTVTGNQALGLNTSGGGVISSYGTNQVNGNGTDGVPTNTITMK